MAGYAALQKGSSFSPTSVSGPVGIDMKLSYRDNTSSLMPSALRPRPGAIQEEANNTTRYNRIMRDAFNGIAERLLTLSYHAPGGEKAQLDCNQDDLHHPYPIHAQRFMPGELMMKELDGTNTSGPSEKSKRRYEYGQPYDSETYKREDKKKSSMLSRAKEYLIETIVQTIRNIMEKYSKQDYAVLTEDAERPSAGTIRFPGSRQEDDLERRLAA